jgi:hypothetical protein
VRPLAALIDEVDPAWPMIDGWVRASRHPVEVLPIDPARQGEVLTLLQVTTRSPLGAIAYQTGGVVVDGWLRLLGGGSPRMAGDLARWNGLGSAPLRDALPGRFIVALDVVGGVFAIRAEDGHVGYFAPDTLAWEDLGRGYGDFIATVLQVDLDQLAAGLRWPGWRDDTRELGLDDGVHGYPPPWSVEGQSGPVSRRAVPLTELVEVGFATARQLKAR